MPGEYKARFYKQGLKLLIPNEKGEAKEHTFLVLSVASSTAPKPPAPPPAVQPPPESQQNNARCNVISTPAGADILVDGKFAGSTPSLLSLKPGNHVLTVALTGYYTWMRELSTEGGSEISVNAVLEKRE